MTIKLVSRGKFNTVDSYENEIKNFGEIEVTREIMEMSGYLDGMDYDEDEDEDGSDIIIPVYIKTEYLKIVIDFCEKFQQEKFEEIQKPLTSNNLTENGVPKWADDFICSLDLQMLQQMILCANYLDLQPLLQLGSARVASLIRGKTPEEIKEIWKDVKELSID